MSNVRHQETLIPPMSSTNQDILRLIDAVLKRWAELQREELAKDIAAVPSQDVFDQWVSRAYWDRLTQVLFSLSDVVPRPSTPEEQLRLVEKMYGELLDLPAHRLAEDVRERLEWFKKRVGRKFERDFRQAVDRHQIESPIEQIFLMEWKFSRMEDQLKVELTPQKPIQTDDGKYLLDFEIVFIDSRQPSFRIGIELDGHEFHERTKDQVARDKRRERAIVRAGVVVLRFSGSEVFKNPRSCVAEVADFIRKNSAPSKPADV